MAVSERTVMFGIGATKAGTSWLHRYLSDHPDCAMPHIKELHYFDMEQKGVLDRERRRVMRRGDALRAELALASGPRVERLHEMIAAHDRWAAVLGRGRFDAAAYLGFLNENAGRARVVGDITPAYALLTEQNLARMQDIAPVTRFVYLLRDPLDRLWSHLRMLAGRAGAGADTMQTAAAALFDDWAKGGLDDVTVRGDYAAALARLDRAVRPENLLVEFYETLFSDSAVGRLCGFLGIAPRPGDYGRRVHASPGAALSPDRAALARALLAPQYEAVASRFGALPAAWQGTERMGVA